MDPWHIAELAVGLVLSFTVAVWRMRDAETQAKVHKLQGQVDMIRGLVERSEERDKGYDKSIDRLEKTLEKFDREIGAKLDRLSDMLGRAYRKLSPPDGVPAVRDPRRE